MQIIINILFWLGIMGLIDGSLGLLYQDKLRKMALKWNIQTVALIEIAIAWCLLAAHYGLQYFSAG